MPAGPTVSALILMPTLKYAESRGISPASLLAAAGLTEAGLEGADARVAFERYEALTRETAERTGDADLGLSLAALMSAGALGILGYVLMNCRNLGEAVDKYCRYQRMTGDGIETTVERRDERWILGFAFFEGCPTPNRHLMEGMMASTVAMMALLSGRPVRPLEVAFASTHPGDDSGHRRIFGSPVRFDRPRNLLAFAEEDSEIPVTQPSRELLALFEKHTVEHLEKLDANLVYARKVGEECARMLQGEAPNIEAVAHRMAMSPRNLQLKLKREGTSYRETLDRVRRDMAVGHLKNRGVTVAEVAYLLGFSEPSVFHRTFKRWTGSTPRDYRRQLAAG